MMADQEPMRITVGDVQEVVDATVVTEAQLAREEAKLARQNAISLPMLVTGIIIFLIAAFLVWKNGFATGGSAATPAPVVDRNNTPETNLAKQLSEAENK